MFGWDPAQVAAERQWKVSRSARNGSENAAGVQSKGSQNGTFRNRRDAAEGHAAGAGHMDSMSATVWWAVRRTPPFLVLALPFLVLALPFLVLSLPFLVLSLPFLVLSLPFLVLSLPFLVLSLPFLVLPLPFLVLPLPFLVFSLPFLVLSLPFLVFIAVQKCRRQCLVINPHCLSLYFHRLSVPTTPCHQCSLPFPCVLNRRPSG